MNILTHKNGLLCLPDGTEWIIGELGEDQNGTHIQLCAEFMVFDDEIIIPVWVYYDHAAPEPACLCNPGAPEEIIISSIVGAGFDLGDFDELLIDDVAYRDAVLSAIHEAAKQADFDKSESVMKWSNW